MYPCILAIITMKCLSFNICTSPTRYRFILTSICCLNLASGFYLAPLHSYLIAAIMKWCYYCVSSLLDVDVFVPARKRVGPFGAILLTFMASSILHVSIVLPWLLVLCLYINFVCTLINILMCPAPHQRGVLISRGAPILILVSMLI